MYTLSHEVIALTASATCLAGVGFMHIVYNSDSDSFGLVPNVLADLAMRPITHLLLAFPIQPFAFRYIAHIADCDLSNFIFDAPIDYCSANLVF
jgi:hypothetical protein